jgi:hypothetical protein
LPQRFSHSLSTSADTQLGLHLFLMAADRFLAKSERFGNFTELQTSRNQAQYCQLAWCQSGMRLH